MRRLLAAVTALALATGAQAAPAMWEARDADSRVVLFGSVHALPPDLEWRTPLLDSAMADGPLVYFETDIGPLGMTALAIKIVLQQLNTLREPWLDRLTPDERDRLAAAIEPLNISLEDAGLMPPWILAMQVADASLRADAVGSTMEMSLGVESVLQWGLPKERKAYFETPGQQFEMLAGGTLDEQIEQLFMTIAESGADDGETLGELVDAWIAGDVDQLTIEAENDSDAALIDKLLHQRNRNWLAAIEGMLERNEENLIVVGAGHLAGEDSVLDLLAEAGYTVRRIQ